MIIILLRSATCIRVAASGDGSDWWNSSRIVLRGCARVDVVIIIVVVVIIPREQEVCGDAVAVVIIVVADVVVLISIAW